MSRRRSVLLGGVLPAGVVLVAVAATALSASAAEPTTVRVSVSSAGEPANGESASPTISGDGRFVTFLSDATNLVPDDTNAVRDLFQRDTREGTTVRVSVSGAGRQGDKGASDSPFSVSADGRFVAFLSYASNLVDGDTNADRDVFVRDTVDGVTTRVTVAPDGGQADQGTTLGPSISADGRFVAFNSPATNLVDGDTNRTTDTFVRDLVEGVTTRVSVAGDGGQVTDSTKEGFLYGPSISADGRYVAFRSAAPGLVPDDADKRTDIFVRDRVAGATTRVNIDTNGATRVPSIFHNHSPISADGRYVAFITTSEEKPTVMDVFVRDVVAGTTSVASDTSPFDVSATGFSADSRYITFAARTSRSTIDPGSLVVRREIIRGSATSVTSFGAPVTAAAGFTPTLSADGRYVAYSSAVKNLVDGDTNNLRDVFVTDLEG